MNLNEKTNQQKNEIEEFNQLKKERISLREKGLDMNEHQYERFCYLEGKILSYNMTEKQKKSNMNPLYNPVN